MTSGRWVLILDPRIPFSAVVLVAAAIRVELETIAYRDGLKSR
jgi:hypothetical protein